MHLFDHLKNVRDVSSTCRRSSKYPEVLQKMFFFISEPISGQEQIYFIPIHFNGLTEQTQLTSQ